MERRNKERKDKERGKAFLVLLALGMIIFSLFKLYDIYISYWSGDDKYNELQELAREQDRDIGQQSGEDQEVKKVTDSGQNADRKKNTGARSEINFKRLKAVNSDIVAWITFEEPSEIDYPVVQGKDNQEYLIRTFDEDGHKYGTLFIDVDNSPDFTDQNTFIYGHHMRNGSMFAGLLDYLDKAYYEEHPYFNIFTGDGRTLTYQVCSVEITAEGTESYRWEYGTGEVWEEYCTFIMNNSQYRTGVNLDADSRLVSLSTCLNTTANQRVLLHGVLIEEP